MDKKNINNKALESLHHYFKNAVDVHKGEGTKTPLTKEQITNEVKQQVNAEEEMLKQRLASVQELKENIDEKVENEYSKIWGAKKDTPEYHKPTVDEFQKQLQQREDEIIAAVKAQLK
ncbi:MAG: hypothetical protein PHH04_05205 [Thomasclavelia sp.]|nr:hypothetical protein [Thomasclavelia sp.]